MTVDAQAQAGTLPYNTESREGQQQESLKGGRAHRYWEDVALHRLI